MPKVRILSTHSNNVFFKADLRVNSAGEFSAVVPDEKATKIFGRTAEEVESRWIKATRDWHSQTKTTRKVIAVRFVTSLIEESRNRDFFKRDHMMLFEALICEETTTCSGEEVTRSLQEHPDYRQMHGPRQPFPWAMQLDDLKASSVVVVPWTPEVEDTLTRAALGLQKVATMLHDVLSTPEGIQLATLRLSDFLALKN